MNRQERELRMHAILAEIEGMKAANRIKEKLSGFPVYGQGLFFKKATELRALADESFKAAELVEDKQERTVKVGQWWIPEDYHCLNKVSAFSDTTVWFNQHIAPCTIQQCLKGKRYKVEEIK